MIVFWAGAFLVERTFLILVQTRIFPDPLSYRRPNTEHPKKQNAFRSLVNIYGAAALTQA